MSKGTLFDKVWDLHTVGTLPSGQTQLFIGLHLIHEVTSPQAFAMLRERGLKVMFPERTVATVDHIVPTDNQARPFKDEMAEEMMQAIERNTKETGITFYGIGSGNQGVVHVIAPEQGLTQPGMTIACGDSHTSTHGAFGAIAFRIGTSQVRDVLASQTLALSKLKVRKIEVNGTLPPGVYAKDVILHIIRKLGVTGGVGYAYEYAGTTFEQMSMEERMTVCNMSIEGGARCGYINPDQVTFDYLKGRDFAPKGAEWDKAVEWWTSIRSDADAEYDDVVIFDAAEIAPTVTWGITPGQGIAVNEPIPTPDSLAESDREIAEEAYRYMDLAPGTPIQGTKIDVCFIGSCTNGRISDLREAAHFYRLDSEALMALNKAILPQEQVASLVDGVEAKAWDEKVLKSYLEAGQLKEIPASRRKRLVILKWLARQFEEGITYPEKAVNQVIQQYHPDSATLRRELIGYRMMQRDKGIYWRLPEHEWQETA
ncbi:3-isopropylmalate dehydratase large subunit [Leptolyngbya sp. 7M]|uniref:3-isopropylmalate dehydratase large subunit n=1 Tax=Leptolyngbya sp. 7M TaxID=2812896 RepID=UPI001B8C6384|nr:3-isopropylmalate dehydratase large subunit [Leptolyngbya sp. 7M]QYO64963.1 3-isopropylmalate dehydratase large subunit [Leptolyngbya sp. 7M]